MLAGMAARFDQERIARSIRYFVWDDPHFNPLPSLTCRCCSHGFPDDKKLFESLWHAAVEDDTAIVPTPTVSQCTSENPCHATLRLQCGRWTVCGKMQLAPPLAAARNAAGRRCSPFNECDQLLTAVCTDELPCGLTTIKMDIDYCRPGFAALRRDGANVICRQQLHADEGGVYHDARNLLMERFELPDIRANWLLRMVPPRGPVSNIEVVLLVFVLLRIVTTAMREFLAGSSHPVSAVMSIVIFVPLAFVLVLLPAEIDRRWNCYIKSG